MRGKQEKMGNTSRWYSSTPFVPIFRADMTTTFYVRERLIVAEPSSSAIFGPAVGVASVGGAATSAIAPRAMCGLRSGFFMFP